MNETEQAYQVWNFGFSWNYLRSVDVSEEHPDGTMIESNGTGFTASWREDKTQEEAEAFAKDWFEKMAETKLKDVTYMDVKMTSILKGRQTWYLQWFSHCSLNRFETEVEAFDSFYKFLRSMNEPNSGYDYPSFGREDGYVGMGAEDRYRWKYCECEDCKKNGITIISH